MITVAYLFALATMALFTATFLLVRRVDSDQSGAGWFAVFFAAGTGATVAHQTLQTLSDGVYAAGFDGAAANTLFAIALVAFGRAMPALFAVRPSPLLVLVLPAAMMAGQLAATLAGDIEMRSWVMGSGALVAFLGNAWRVRSQATTGPEWAAVATVAVGSILYVGAPAYAIASGTVVDVAVLASRAQLVSSAFLGLVVGSTLLAVYAHRIHARLVSASNHDPLTGLLNRRGLEIACAGLPDGERSLIAYDIDHFKGVNDRHGHAAGDAALRLTASVARGATRTGDIVARSGGEEFVVVLPGAGSSEAHGVAERVRLAMEAMAVPALRGEGMTVSLGVSAWLAHEPMHIALDRADAALYAAKRDGRNRTVVARPRHPTGAADMADGPLDGRDPLPERPAAETIAPPAALVPH